MCATSRVNPTCGDKHGHDGHSSVMGLQVYRKKRKFDVTPEPRGKAAARRKGNRFVIQKHAARRLHYDFRLELDGVMKSWAVTRGPSLVPGREAPGRAGRGPSDRVQQLRGHDPAG